LFKLNLKDKYFFQITQKISKNLPIPKQPPLRHREAVPKASRATATTQLHHCRQQPVPAENG